MDCNQGSGGFNDLPVSTDPVETTTPPRLARGNPVGVNKNRNKSTSLPYGCIARTVGKKVMLSTPKAADAVREAYDKLVKQGAWCLDDVEEWHDVRERERTTGKKVHIGRIFAICVEKGSELPGDRPDRKFKGRIVFMGNEVRDEYHEYAIFQDLSSSPAALEAAKA